MAFCHECGIEIRPLMTPDPTCPRCNGQFVEIIDESSASTFLHEDDDDEASPFNNPFAPLPAHAFPGPQGGGGLLNQLFTAMAAGSQRNSQGPASPNSNRRTYTTGGESTDRSQDASSTTRSGTTSFGPFGLQWNVQYGTGGGDPYQTTAQHQADQNQRQQSHDDLHSPPTLSNFLRFAFGGADSTDDSATRPDAYFHDDGMGGAGGVADGRHFNHDNRGTYHQPPQSPNNDPSGRNTATGAGRPNNDLPPELSALRNLFTGLFGEPGAQGGSLLDILAAGAQGGAGGARGQWGDYVLGQQGLDDIISQLMEQTQGSNAPPPAAEDVIDKLERFTLQDKARIQKARNQDCPTCKDEFLPSAEATAGSGDDAEKAAEEEEGEDDQQHDLISMPCGHIFHVDCLVPWLRLNGTCPVCRISIAKPREAQDESSSSNGNAAQQPNADGGSTAVTGSEAVPGGWPTPPDPFTAMFNRSSGQGVQVPHDSAAASTTTFHPQPPASTTITSTVYTSPAAAAAHTAGANGQVINSIVSSPPIVSDREEYFAEPASREQEQEHSGRREDMRETLRRAAEARARGGGGEGDGGGAQRQRRDWLEPDELD
ncbi:zinc finger containing protein [Pseudozyma hubeiensis SY62]|uniref:RING-type E3 ubiquitin transferase n=1 Tax=Pseudozyma hubeiensis (strain SY62) TaxID=1305764 RepID=R9PEQ5_PSEHS|nr:zinc finger containing protein [Pseudozyma hubeiensis SY62]GAC99742.1 zinc finger containing protein [Pseudozyma hubeiensis SY62]